jgi:hypothetical protein
VSISHYVVMAVWLAFGVVWNLGTWNLVSMQTEEVLNLCCDFGAKVSQQAPVLGPHSHPMEGLLRRPTGPSASTAEMPASTGASRHDCLLPRPHGRGAALPPSPSSSSLQVLFSSGLMLSSFKNMEVRREKAMRMIETSSKLKLVEELKVLLEQ